MLREQTDELTQEIRASNARLKAHILQGGPKVRTNPADALDRNFDALDGAAERFTRIFIAYIIFLAAFVVLACWVMIKILCTY